MKRTIIGTTAALALGASSLFLPSIATPASAGPKTAPTRFVLGASGYGSRVGGGDAPASSGRSAFQILG